MAYSLPDDVHQRPVTIDGAGTLGRRIATVFAAGGSDVRLFDTSAEQLEAGRDHVEQHVAEVQQTLDLRPDRTGGVEAAGDLSSAVDGAWLVIESVPERVDVKIDVFGELDRVAAPDAILATNSSSLPSRLVIDKVRHPERVLNMHYQQPPELNAVELMSCGRTDPAIIDALMDKLPDYGLAPFRLMDRVGLDVVLAIEEHYAEVRDGIPEGPRTLLRPYVDEGRLGTKSGGGFYDEAS